MIPSKAAWCMREFLGNGLVAGRTQTAIGEQLNLTSSCICSALMKFYADFGYWSNEFSHILDYNKRRNHYFRQALDNYIFAGHEIVEPTLSSKTGVNALTVSPAPRPTASSSKTGVNTLVVAPGRISNDHPVWYSTEPNLQASARAEHAWLLRAEGLTYRQVGERLGGISASRAQQIVHRQGRRVARALRHTIFEIEYPEDREAEYFEMW